MKPEKIISGGQTGADQGALVGARMVGIPTGGWMPRGFKTEFGLCPELARAYDMREHPSELYPPRTAQNVKDADGTIWVSDEDLEDSTGKRCTKRAVEKFNRPYLENPTPQRLREWIEEEHIRILNVAGPRRSRDKFAHQRAAELIIAAFGDGL